VVLTARVRRPGPFVRVTFSSSGTAVFASVRGADRTQVEGVAVRVFELLGRGERGLRERHAVTFAGLCVVLFVATMFVALGATPEGDFVVEQPIGLAMLICWDHLSFLAVRPCLSCG
jgi:hypothetical protein